MQKLKYCLGLPKFPGTKNLYEHFLNNMIPFEIFKSVEFCASVLRFLFEFAKYIYTLFITICMYVCPWVCFLYTTRRLGKYLKAHSTSGTCMMSNEDIVPAYWYPKGNVTCVSNEDGVGLQFLAQSHGGKYFGIANQYIYNTART